VTPHTQILKLSGERDAYWLSIAAKLIQRGKLVAFPTETVYGLGANALDADAVARIYEAKQRALNDPLIVHVARKDVGGIANLRALGRDKRALAVRLTETFWPGPLTLVLPRAGRIPPIVSAGLDTVAIRMPDHPIALELIRKSGAPIAAPSANRFGHVSPTTAQHVLNDLDGRIDMVIDGGPTRIGVESTVLDLTSDPPRILRPGGVTREALARKIGDWRSEIDSQSPISNLQSLPSPGLLDKHYAPRAKLIVVRDTQEMLEQHAALSKRQMRVGLLIVESQRAACQNLYPQFVLGRDATDAARNLYAGLRALDNAGVDAILVAEVERTGLGEAVADRLKRAASGGRLPGDNSS
jgi:L-threonylcarbamoyladenylate synthase